MFEIFQEKTKLSSSGGKSERLKRPGEGGKKEAAGGLLSMFFFLGRGWLPKRCTDSEIYALGSSLKKKSRVYAFGSFYFSALSSLKHS